MGKGKTIWWNIVLNDFTGNNLYSSGQHEFNYLVCNAGEGNLWMMYWKGCKGTVMAYFKLLFQCLPEQLRKKMKTAKKNPASGPRFQSEMSLIQSRSTMFSNIRLFSPSLSIVKKIVKLRGLILYDMIQSAQESIQDWNKWINLLCLHFRFTNHVMVYLLQQI